MKFSIIIPTYERASFLKEALDSVLMQSLPDFEVIVVDDFSPNPVVLPTQDDRVRLLRRETNGGPAAARNSGIDASEGDFIVFLDDDDLYTPDRLRHASRALEHSDVSICAAMSIGSTKVREPLEVTEMFNTFTPSVHQVAVRREICPHFDERFVGCQDIDWLIRLVRDVDSSRISLTKDVGCAIRSHSGVRGINGTRARVEGSRLLLRVHQEFFRSHRQARAFRWYRIACMSVQLGNPRLTLIGSIRSSLALPTWPNLRRNIWQIYKMTRRFASTANQRN